MLTSCARTLFMYKFPYKSENVIMMRIYQLEESISYNNTEQFNELKPAKVIDEKDYEILMEEVETIPFQHVIILVAAAPSPESQFNSYVLYVEYDNGEKSIISNHLRLDYTIDGKCIGDHYGYGESFNELMERYINN